MNTETLIVHLNTLLRWHVSKPFAKIIIYTATIAKFKIIENREIGYIKLAENKTLLFLCARKLITLQHKFSCASYQTVS